MSKSFRNILIMVITFGIGIAAGAMWHQERTSPCPRLSTPQKFSGVQQIRSPEKAGRNRASDVYLRRLISIEYPDIDSMPDYEKANALREYVYKTIDHACYREALSNAHYLHKQPISESIVDFLDDTGGGFWCAGMAQVLNLLYEFYGFESVYFAYGIQELMLTHAVVLVKIKINDTDRIIIQDPFFNITYVDPSGSPYAFEEFMSKLKGGNHEQIKISSSPDIMKDVVACLDNIEASWLYGEDTVFVCRLSENRYKFSTIVSVEKFYKGFSSSIEKALTERGLITDPLYLFMYPYGLHGKGGKLRHQIWGWMRVFLSTSEESGHID